MSVFSTCPNKTTLTVVDASEAFVGRLAVVLAPYFDVSPFSNCKQALAALQASPPDVLIVNERIQPWGVIPFLDEIAHTPALAAIPIICTSERGSRSDFFSLAKARGLTYAFEKPLILSDIIDAIHALVGQKVEASWQKIEPVQQSALVKTLQAFNSIPDLLIKGAPLPYQAVSDSCQPLIEAVRNNQYKDMLQGVQKHDNYSYVHSLRVATFLSLFGHKIGIKGDDLNILATGGLVHDIGKMSIPFEVLNKAGKLDDKEWVIMKSHVANTLDYLSKSPGIPHAVITIASQHHEKLNGKGYPKGLAGHDLNDLARMATIVDIFGALTDRRVYKPPMAPEVALELMSGLPDEIDQSFLSLFKEMLLEATQTLPQAA